jgi:hypothetical protein
MIVENGLPLPNEKEMLALLNLFGEKRHRSIIIVEGKTDWEFWSRYAHCNSELHRISSLKTPNSPKSNKDTISATLNLIGDAFENKDGTNKLAEAISVMGLVDEDHDMLVESEAKFKAKNEQVILVTTRPFRDRENMLLHYVDTKYDVETIEAKELARKLGILRTIQQKRRQLADDSDKIKWNLSFKNKEQICIFLENGEVEELIKKLMKISGKNIATSDEWLEAMREGEALWGGERFDSKIIQGHDWITKIVLLKWPKIEQIQIRKFEKIIENELANVSGKEFEDMVLTKRIRKKEKELQTNFLSVPKK